MNKLILLVIAIFFGCVLSTGMMEAPKPKYSEKSFDCTILAIKTCGTEDNVCLNEYVKKCNNKDTVIDEKTINDSLYSEKHINHHSHHSYKTSILVKHSEEEEDEDNDEVKRICITDTNCNCKAIAKTKCEKSEDSNCYDDNVSQCESRCKQSRRCYKMDCENAGKTRCETDANLECSLKHPDSHHRRRECEEEKTSCCLNYEKATCKRAIRVYKYRTECQTESQTKCHGITDDSAKCTCVSQTRHACLVKKVDTHRQTIRQVFDCEESAHMICSEKKCGYEYQLCVKREKSICEPVCHKESREKCNNQINGLCYEDNYKKCIHEYKLTYCEKRAIIKCGDNDECFTREKHHCKRDEPTCMNGEVSCDDKNKCTEDICHPTKGCINKPINCDDNNACTTESCHPQLGCVYQTKKCDDNKLCTKDSCNPVSGKCQFVYDNTICHVCENGYCEKDQDCAAWEKGANLEKSCQKAVCNLEHGSCQAVQVKGCAQKCKESCNAYHACDTATCVKNEKTSEYECVHTAKDCNDHKSCTVDTCDQKLGCVHKLESETCPPNPLCENDSECVAWETSKNLKNNCQKAFCDKHKGICLAVSTSQECDEKICLSTCKPINSCEVATCVKGDTGKYNCAKQPAICDDKKGCTVDTCDDKTGCVFTYKVDNEVCLPGLQCEHSADCKTYETKEKLADRCMKSVCDLQLGACVIVPVDTECDIKLKQCQLNCKSTNQCQDAICVKDESSNYVCKSVDKKCDDGKECTVDTCDNTLGCVHKYKENEKTCPIGGECKIDADCVTWGFTQKIGRLCQRPVCDTTTGGCKAVPKLRKCIPPTECDATCRAQNSCETTSCELNDEGDYYCKRVSNFCNDNNDCTIDSCDVSTGKCVFTPTDKCTKVTDKCTKQSDCDVLNKKLSEDCKSAICDTTSQTCKVTVDQKCEDSRVCKKNCVARSNCEEAVCVYDETSKKHTCKRTQSTDKKCDTRETDCQLKCKPANLCETTSCAKQTDGSFTCLRSVNTCNDNKSCTKDSCDLTTGKCVNTYVISEDCPPGGVCEKNLDCVQWGLKQELDNCLTAVCDSQTGGCKSVPNAVKCSSKTCNLKCPPRNQCEDSTCAYDLTTKKLVCEYKTKSCDDKNRCTVDSCDINKGCVNTFDRTINGCDAPRCENTKDCVKFAEQYQLADDCKEATCDIETKTCKAIFINNPKCNPVLNKCKKECVPRTACETADCIVDANTQKFRCQRKPITCDDKNPCTLDVCDPIKGCKFTYTVSDKCEQFCDDNNDCATYGLKKQASLSCQVPYCDKTTSSCRLQEDPNKNCKRVDTKCQTECKPKDACSTARCVRKGENDFTCVQESIKCDDGESCTEDSCDAKTGCVFKFKESTTCKKPCKVDIDCDNWAVTEKLADKCQKAFCSRKLGSCVAIKGVQTEKCRTTDQCKATSDCPQGSKYGSVCCEENGVKQCCEHQCDTDLDCVPKDKKKQWGYCKIRDSGKKECEYREKCKGNEDCDDKNPCTKDVCLTEYGFCKNIRRCVDNTACTYDICIPGTDGKSFTCKNPSKTCTNDKTLLDKNYDKLSKKDQTRWLGKCSHLEGCVSCVVNAQCDDNNGCTEDSCINQFCVSKPIDNKWCDPKLEGQAITVQGYFPKFTRL